MQGLNVRQKRHLRSRSVPGRREQGAGLSAQAYPLALHGQASSCAVIGLSRIGESDGDITQRLPAFSVGEKEFVTAAAPAVTFFLLGHSLAVPAPGGIAESPAVVTGTP